MCVRHDQRLQTSARLGNRLQRENGHHRAEYHNTVLLLQLHCVRAGRCVIFTHLTLLVAGVSNDSQRLPTWTRSGDKMRESNETHKANTESLPQICAPHPITLFVDGVIMIFQTCVWSAQHGQRLNAAVQLDDKSRRSNGAHKAGIN